MAHYLVAQTLRPQWQGAATGLTEESDLKDLAIHFIPILPRLLRNPQF